MSTSDQHEHYMKLALQEAKKASAKGEIPVGSIIVMQDQVIAKGYNQVEQLKDATAHAEIIALTAAFQSLGAKYLPGATMYVTLEPCLMCAGAMYWSRIGGIVYGAEDLKNGFRKHCTAHPFHPKTTVQSGILAAESGALMTDFFRQRRASSI
jgi:tRNA(adenine34) deaminase